MILETLSKHEIIVLKILLKILSAAVHGLDNPDVLASIKSENNSAFYTIQETADLLRCKPKTISNQICKNSQKQFPIKKFKHGGRVLFRKEDVHDYIANGG